MKIRNGFVSNSSSSSFCIYGVCGVPIEKIKKAANKLGFKEYLQKQKEYCEKHGGTNIEDYESYYGDEECFCMLAEKTDLIFESINTDQEFYVGMRWSSIKDNETGAQFKDRVKAELKKLGIAASKAKTYEEAWYPC